MALKNLFDMVKADRYTADGREAIIKAQEAETEDKVYQIGEISQKTGLQKTANGWVKPKNGKQPGAKKEEPKNVHGAEVDKIYERQLKRIKELKAKGFTDEQIDNDKIIKQTKEDMKNVGKKPESKPAEKHPPMVMPKGMSPAEFMKAWEDDAKKNGFKKGQGNEWREHLRKEEAESKPAAEKIPHNFSRGDRYKNKYGENIDIDEIDEDTISYTKTNVDGSRENHEMPADKFKAMLKGEEFTEGSNTKASRQKLRADMETAANAGSKPAAQEVKLGGGADTYYFEDPDNMSNEDKVFKSLGIELAETFGDHDGDPGNVETWANAWLDNTQNEGGLGIKSKKTRQPAAPVPAEEVMKIVEENPARWNRIIGNAKKFYEGKGSSTDFESDESYPIKLVGGKTKPSAQYYAEGKRNKKNNPLTGSDAAPRVLTGDTRIRVRKA